MCTAGGGRTVAARWLLPLLQLSVTATTLLPPMMTTTSPPPAGRGLQTDGTSSGCYDNCTQLTVENGYLVSSQGKAWVGRKWSSIMSLLAVRMPAAGPLPGLDANASTMRTLTLRGDYLADVPLQLPSRLHFRLDGSVRGNLTSANQGGDASCRYGISSGKHYYGMCALVLIDGSSFVSVTGGTYTCTGGTAFAISCEGCSSTLIQNLTASGCGLDPDHSCPEAGANIHLYGAGPAVEIKNVESFNSNRGVWNQVASQKVLITDSYLHDNDGDGVDLDSYSAHVMVRRCRLLNNKRCGVFMEEGASNNVVIDNYMANNTYGVSFFTDLGGQPPYTFPTKDNWVIGNTFEGNQNAISLGGVHVGDGATDNLIAENKITGNVNSFWCNNALSGNHVLPPRHKCGDRKLS